MINFYAASDVSFTANNGVDGARKFVTLLLFCAIGACVGFYGWGNSAAIGALFLLILLPLFWGLAANRWSASIFMLAYFLASARGLPSGAGVFFGNGAAWWAGWALWLSACVFLTAPFLLLWTGRVSLRPLRFVLAVIVSLVPPIGLIGWVNPVASAGVYFPALGWLGLFLMLTLMWALVARSSKWIVIIGGVSILVNLWFAIYSDVKVPDGWHGVDTRFSGLSSAGSDDAGQILASWKRVEWVKHYAEGMPSHSVSVLPETLLGSYSAVADYSLMEVKEKLTERGSRLLVGAELAQPDGHYLNGLMVLGSREGENGFVAQGVPVPVSMWMPWAQGGAVANIFGGGGVVRVNDVRAGVLVCYEQLLSFSALKVMRAKPDVLVGAANVWWVKDASIPAIQGQMLSVYGRLFGVPVVRAVNY